VRAEAEDSASRILDFIVTSGSIDSGLDQKLLIALALFVLVGLLYIRQVI